MYSERVIRVCSFSTTRIQLRWLKGHIPVLPGLPLRSLSNQESSLVDLAYLGGRTSWTFAMLEDKYIGLALAITSTMAIGTSFVITKKGLLEASERHGFEGDGFAYLKSPTWWGGIVTLVVGEVANFAAYAFAPAILVTPLGALSVLIGAVLGAYFLQEELGVLGRLGCAICLIGSVIIVLHAPPDKEIQTVDEIIHDAMQPGT